MSLPGAPTHHNCFGIRNDRLSSSLTALGCFKAHSTRRLAVGRSNVHHSWSNCSQFSLVPMYVNPLFLFIGFSLSTSYYLGKRCALQWSVVRSTPTWPNHALQHFLSCSGPEQLLHFASSSTSSDFCSGEEILIRFMDIEDLVHAPLLTIFLTSNFRSYL